MNQRIRKITTWTAVTVLTGALLTAPVSAQPTDAVGDDIPVTDPALLARLGFETDATDVYATPRAYEQLLMSPAERAAVQAATVDARREEIRAAQRGGESRGPFGTATVGYSTMNSGFQPLFFDDGYAAGLGIECIPGAQPAFIALGELQNLPHGAKLERIDIRYVDNSVEALDILAVRGCYPDAGDGAPALTFLGQHTTTGSASFVRFASIGPLDEDIDLQSCFYTVHFRPPTPCPEDGEMRLAQVRAQWRRQVSPPPATATFGDVPTSHLFFQHIEALAASGVTGGCGGGDFCPGEPLTRGQMAAFLANALGLHWGEISQP